MVPSIIFEALPMNSSTVSAVRLGFVLIALAALPSRTQSQQEQQFPDVIAVEVKAVAPDVFDFYVTVSSPVGPDL